MPNKSEESGALSLREILEQKWEVEKDEQF
jgi:hypothetical protein